MSTGCLAEAHAGADRSCVSRSWIVRLCCRYHRVEKAFNVASVQLGGRSLFARFATIDMPKRLGTFSLTGTWEIPLGDPSSSVTASPKQPPSKTIPSKFCTRSLRRIHLAHVSAIHTLRPYICGNGMPPRTWSTPQTPRFAALSSDKLFETDMWDLAGRLTHRRASVRVQGSLLSLRKSPYWQCALPLSNANVSLGQGWRW